MKFVLEDLKLNVHLPFSSNVHENRICFFEAIFALGLKNSEGDLIINVRNVFISDYSSFETVPHFSTYAVKTLVILVKVVEFKLKGGFAGPDSARWHQLLRKRMELCGQGLV